jgi:hypothetical protein
MPRNPAVDSCDNWPFSTRFPKCNAHADDDIGSIAKEIAADPDNPPAQRLGAQGAL